MEEVKENIKEANINPPKHITGTDHFGKVWADITNGLAPGNTHAAGAQTNMPLCNYFQMVLRGRLVVAGFKKQQRRVVGQII